MKFLAGKSAFIAVALKELLHLWRDRRILMLVIFLPPVFTLLLGHAFEEGALRNVPAILLDNDRSAASQKLCTLLRSSGVFNLRPLKVGTGNQLELAANDLAAAIIIPGGWEKGLHDGEPIPLELVLDGADGHTAPEVQGAVQAILGEYQSKALESMIDNLPEEVFDLGRQLPISVRKDFSSSMSPWGVKASILYNPDLTFIHFVMPGIVGLLLQLLTITMTACSISRERESGTLTQLQVAPIHKWTIIIGKVLPYLGIALCIEAMLFFLGQQHFHVACRNPMLLFGLSFVFLLSTSGVGALISSISRSQTQAIQYSVFFLLPVFLLSGAFAPVSQLPFGVRIFSYAFPLTYFCHACREINLYGGGITRVMLDLVLLSLSALLTCSIAAYRLRAVEV
jgi:ABC-type multidrug transport system permease subunit